MIWEAAKPLRKTDNESGKERIESHMDERIKQGYHKIYSELFFIILMLAASSLVVNVIFFHKDITQLWLEYLILVGSPIYRLIRIRMLEIVDAPAAGWRKVFGIRFAAALTGSLVLFLVISYARLGRIDLLPILGFLIPFVITFCLVAFATKKLQDSWKKKLDRKYEEKE